MISVRMIDHSPNLYTVECAARGYVRRYAFASTAKRNALRCFAADPRAHQICLYRGDAVIPYATVDSDGFRMAS